jgi:predicted Zn-dependent protease
MLETGAHAVAIATTRGCARAHDGTQASLRVWALEDAAGRGASGHGAHLVRDVRDLAVDRAVEEAVRFARQGKDPKTADAGTWDVVMEPPAVAELLEWLSAITFAAPEIEQGTSAFAAGLGARVTGEDVTIVEHPLDSSELGFGDPFDREGTPREEVTLVDRGAAAAVLYDRTHAARAGARSTGSAVLSGFGAPAGVGGSAVQLSGGSAKSSEELLAGMDRGLYVRRLHYVNGYLEPKRAGMTGLSRDGCFLVERGRIRCPVGNVRFTDSFLEMLARADAMTAARAASATSWIDGGTVVAPAVRFRGVRITSGSQR